MDVAALVLSGATLASLCSSAASLDGDSDGLLFGQVHLKRETRVGDGERAEVAERLEAHVSGCCVCGGSLSFHSPSGAVDRGRLDEVARDWPEPVLGWIRMRRSSPMEVGLRERRVTREMAALMAAEGPDAWPRSPWGPLAALAPAPSAGRPAPAAVFGLVSLRPGADPHGPSLADWLYRFWRCDAGGALAPLPVHVRNLADEVGTRHYRPLAPLPAVAVAPGVVEAAREASESAARAAEGAYRALLSQLGDDLVRLRRQDLEIQNGLSRVQQRRNAIRQRVAAQQAQGPGG